MTISFCRSFAFRPLLGAAVLAMSLAQSGHAQTQELPDMAQIEQAWQQGDFVAVRTGLKQLAEGANDPVAHYRYGRVLAEGRGGPRDLDGAVMWLEKAVAQNHAPAATLLARLLLSSKSRRDPAGAARLFTSAATRGDTEAQYYLGLLYQSGNGVPQDTTAAFDWFLASSEGQNVQAQWELSKAYANGSGTAQNMGKAVRWMQEAAANGQADAQYFLGVAYDQGTAIAPNQSQAVAWYRRASEGGQVQAQRTLGTIYLNGSHDQQPNSQEAQRWLNAAADAGDVVANYRLGVGYASGDVLPQDLPKAQVLFEGGALKNYPPSSFALGQLYEHGRGVPVDLEAAVARYVTAASQGFKPAALHLGALTSSGALDSVVAPQTATAWALIDLRETQNSAARDWLQDRADAGVRQAQAGLGAWLLDQDGMANAGFELVEKAAIAGDVPSQFRLGSMLTTGTGAALDYVAAHAWLNIAAASGHEDAAATRALINDLMTPDQVAAAQTIARVYFDGARARAPQTQQTVTTMGADQ